LAARRRTMEETEQEAQNRSEGEELASITDPEEEPSPFRADDEEDDYPSITGMSRGGVHMSDHDFVLDLLRDLRQQHQAEVAALRVKIEEGEEERTPISGRPPPAFDGILRRLSKGVGRYDPAVNPGAEHKWRHSIEGLDVKTLKQTHDVVSETFAHGPHRGKPVEGLTRELQERHGDTRKITPLVVIRGFGADWVVFGNRRLKALKMYAASRQKPVLMRCIVHNFEGKDESIPKDLLAKFLRSASTRNGGDMAVFRRFSIRQ